MIGSKFLLIRFESSGSSRKFENVVFFTFFAILRGSILGAACLTTYSASKNYKKARVLLGLGGIEDVLIPEQMSFL